MHEIFFVILILAAVVAVETKDLLHSTIILAGFSLVLTFLFFAFQALDVAIAEAAIGAGVSTVLFVVAISKTMRREE